MPASYRTRGITNPKEEKQEETRKNAHRYAGLDPYAKEETAEERAKRLEAAAEANRAIGATVANAGVNVGYGAAEATEGASDFLRYTPQTVKAIALEKAANLLGYLADTVGLEKAADYFSKVEEYEIGRQNKIQEKINYDLAGDIFGRDAEGEGYLDWQWGNKLSEKSQDAIGENANRVLEEISQGVGGMLPMVAISIASGGSYAGLEGADAIAKAAQATKALQTGLFFAQAAGQATESAGKRGATPKAALVYGLASGAVEAGTEWLGGSVFGEASGGLIGKGLDKIAPGLTNRILASTGGQLLWTFAGEAFEEGLSHVIDPYLDAGAGIADLPTWDEIKSGLLEDMAVGGTVGVLLNGLSSGISNIQNHSKGGSTYTKTMRSMQTVLDAMQANEAVKASSKSTQDRVNRMETATAKLIQNELNKMSTELKKMTATERAGAFSDAPVLSTWLDENGNIRKNTAAALQSQISSGTASNTSETIFNSKEEAANLAKVAEQVGKSVEYDSDPLTPAERKNMASLLDANRQVNEFMVSSSMDDAKAKVVIYKGADSTIKGFTAPITLGNTVYISRSSLSDGTAIQKYIHEELGHQQGVSMDRAALSELSSDTELRNKAISDLVNTDNQGYSAEEISEIIGRGEKGEVLTGAEAKVFDEYGARLLEFGLDAKSISRITQENPTGLRKISLAISDFVESRKNRKLTDSERNRLQALRRAERSIRASLENTKANRIVAYNATKEARSGYIKDRATYLGLEDSKKEKWLKDHGYTAEDFAPGVLEKEDISTLPQKYREEYLAASKETEQAETKKAAEAGRLQGDIPKITLSSDTELSERLSGLRGSKRYKALENFLMEKFQDHEFTLSDGLKAIMTRSDADELSHGAEEMRTAELANLADIVERAVFVSSADHVTHSKFSSFRYYAAEVSFGSESDKILLNVGKGKFDHKNHIYAITGYNEKRTAGRASLGLPGSVDDRVKSGSSNNSIPQNSDLSTPESKKSSDVKFSKSAEATEKVEIARIFTFGCKNNADIIRRLMGTSKFFKGMSFYDAAQQFRYAERNGLVHRGDGFLVVYHDPNPDIRFSKVDPRPGQSKVYSKEDAADVISSIMAERMKFGDEHFAIEAGLRKGKTAEATRQLFEYLNTLDPGERGGAALKLADFIVENAITTQVWDDLKVDDEILERDRDIVSLMNGLRHRIDFGPYKADIVHIYDKKRSRGMFLQWGTSQANARRAVGMDQIADLFDEIGVRIESDQHPVEIFSRAMDLYDAAKDELGSVMGTVRLTKYLDEGQVEALKQDIAKDLLRAYDEKGEPSILKTKLDALKEELQQTKASAAAERKIAKVRLSVLRDLRFLRAATNRTYAEKNNIPISANLPSNPAFKGLAKDVASVMRGDNISPQKTREMMVAVGDHLTNGNEIYREWLEAIGDEENPTPLRQELVARLADVTGVSVLREADGAFSKADLTLDEWQSFSKLVKLVKTVYTKYDNFYEDGKRYNLTEATTRYQEITHFAIDSKSTDERAFWRMIGEAEDAYSRTFCTPQVFCERADGYNKDGFYSHYLSRFTIDTLNMEIKKAQAMEKLEAFAKKHKRFDKRLKERIAYDGAGGRKISVGEAMDIWLMSTQENGFLTLTEERGGGVNCSDERGMDTIKGLKFTKESLDALYQSFTAEDREFIGLIQEGYKDIGALREDGNLRMLGFNYGVSGNYYTLVRSSGNMQGNFDASREGRDIQTVYNNSWQKARREQAMVIPLQASDVLEKFNGHVNSVVRFWALGEDMQNFGRIYNKDLSELRNGKKTMRRLLNDLYPTQTGKGEKVGKGEAYLKKLINDIQGVSSKRTTAREITRRLRSGYATAVLGLNLGVSASQLASIPNALPYIDFDVMLKAFGSMRRTEGTAAMDQYSKTALVRSLDKGVVRAEGLVEKVGKVADKTTFLIQKSDRAAITFLWKCAQLQVAKTQGVAVGTEENLKAAGLLLDRINTETQPTYQATDRSLFQRDEHELVKSISMFQSVPTKQRSMIISAIGEAKALGAQVKYVQKQLQSGNLSAEEKAQYTEQLKDLQERKQQSKPKVARAISGVVLAQAVYAAVRMGVGRLLHQKDDEPVGEDFLERTKDAMISIFPIFKELYEGLIKGNELEETTLSMVNNLITGVKSIYDADNPEQRNKALLNLGYDAFMVFGLPAKNVRNIIVGAIKYSPDAYDRLEEPFQVATTKKMATALERGDYDFAGDLAVRIMADKGLDISKEQGRLLADLYSKNYSLPSGTITQYTIDGTTYTLTDAEKANFSLVYGDAGAAADELIGKSSFAKLSDSGKNKAISTLYSYYRDKAKTETVGIDASKLYLMGTAVGADTLALILAQIQDLLDKAKASGKDYNRKELITAFLKRQDLTAVQKYMVMGYLGYKNKNGSDQVRAYINKMKLTKKEKQALYEASGY